MAADRLRWVIIDSALNGVTSCETDWEGAPGWDCQVVLFRHPDPKVRWGMRHGGDFFRLAEDGTIVAMDLMGMIHYVVNVLGIIKVGAMLTEAEWKRVYQHAKGELARLKEAD